jgi:CheY-like chemotaxis protein
MTFARSRSSAVAALEGASFDLVILDLKLPTSDGALDEDQAHGLEVHAEIRARAAGTPVIMFSAHGTVQLAVTSVNKSEREDAWGSGVVRPLTDFLEKTQLNECLSRIRTAADEVGGLTRIELSYGQEAADLGIDRERVLRIFARCNNGAHVRIARLGGGLSSARTLRIRLDDERGNVLSSAVVKLAEISTLFDEFDRYNRYVSPALKLGGFAHVIRFVRAGAGNYGGLFYGLAEHDMTLRDLIAKDSKAAASVADQLRGLEEKWQAASAVRMSVKQIRQNLASDDDLVANGASLGFDWQQLEAREARVKWCRQHRDLHALNVLVSDAGDAVIIDYGEVELAPASLDPLTLELSLLFHPAMKSVVGDWPTTKQAEQWDDLSAYSKGCPCADFIAACRSWTFAAEASDNGVYATLYSYAVRQLRYHDTNQELAVALANCARRRLEP